MNNISILFVIALISSFIYALVVDSRAREQFKKLIGRNKNGTFKEQKKAVVALNWIIDSLVVNRWKGGQNI